MFRTNPRKVQPYLISNVQDLPDKQRARLEKSWSGVFFREFYSRVDEQTFAIIGAAMAVHSELGNGFLEAVYQECLKREFTLRNIPFSSQQDLEIINKGEVLPLTYRPDFICFDKIIIELKAVKGLTDEHRAQLHNYLKISGYKLGFLVNFCHYPKAEVERIVR